jgi:putative ABC transport system ATP-binding protein
MIECQGIGKIYGTGTSTYRALKDIHLQIRQGEMVALTGRSGSGKSTLMNLIGLLDRPTEGMLSLEGQSMADCSDETLALHRNRMIGFVFQQYHLLPRMSVLENVGLPLWYRGMSEETRDARAMAMLEELEMAAFAKAYPNTLSGGQQQRVAIARALVGEPQLLLADEPTGALDTVHGHRVMDLLKESNAKRGMTVLVVTHNLEIENLAERILTLVDGRLQ